MEDDLKRPEKRQKTFHIIEEKKETEKNSEQIPKIIQQAIDINFDDDEDIELIKFKNIYKNYFINLFIYGECGLEDLKEIKRCNFFNEIPRFFILENFLDKKLIAPKPTFEWTK